MEEAEEALKETLPLGIQIDTNHKYYYLEGKEEPYLQLQYCDVSVEGDDYLKLKRNLENWSMERSEGLRSLYTTFEEQLCEQVEPDGKKRAMDLENSTVLVAAMVPWSIACATPLASVNAPIGSVLFAFFLYFVPVWRLIVEAVSRKKKHA